MNQYHRYQALADRKGDPTASKGATGTGAWKPTENTMIFFLEAPGLKPAWEQARHTLKSGTVRAQKLITGEQGEISGPRYTIKYVKRYYGKPQDIVQNPIQSADQIASTVRSIGTTNEALSSTTAPAQHSSPETIREILDDARRRISVAADVPVHSVEISLRIT